MPTAAEDEIVTRCAPWLIVDPKDSSDFQQNELVNLIIDRGWDLQISDSRLFFHILQKGDGQAIKWGDRLEVNYTGYDLQLQVFDSSYKRGGSFEFYLGNVIRGWNEGLPLINEGGRIILVIPAYKAYGSEGFGRMVAPDQHLIFDIEILRKINTGDSD